MLIAWEKIVVRRALPPLQPFPFLACLLTTVSTPGLNCQSHDAFDMKRSLEFFADMDAIDEAEKLL